MITLVVCLAVSFFSTFYPASIPREYSQALGQARVVMLGSLSALLVVYFIAGCTPAQKAKAVESGADVAVCIAKAEMEGKTPEETTQACAGTTIEGVVAVLTAQHAMEAKRCVTILDAGAYRDVKYGPGL